MPKRYADIRLNEREKAKERRRKKGNIGRNGEYRDDIEMEKITGRGTDKKTENICV